MVLLSAQGMDVEKIAKVAFTSPDRVRDVINNFNEDGFDSLYPRYAGGRPPTFTLPERQAIKKMALSRPVDHGLPFSTWSLTKLADFLVAEGVVDDISHEGLRDLLHKEGVSFQVIKTYKQSNDPDYEQKKNRVLELYDIADGKVKPKRHDPKVVICMDEFGPLNIFPRPGKQWAPTVSRNDPGSPEHPRRRRRRATYKRDKAHRHRARQLQPAPVDQPRRPRRCMGQGQQHRVRLRTHRRQLAQSHRMPVHRVALLRSRRHRPPESRRAELHDPALHRLAKPEHRSRCTS
jgi:transposase